MGARGKHPKRDEFAELLSQDLSKDEIMERMGISKFMYRKHLRAIKSDLGWIGD